MATTVLDEREALIRRIQEFEDIFCNYLNDEQIRKIIGKLIEIDGISLDHVEHIREQLTRFERVSALMYHIYRSDLRIIKCFLDVLQYTFPSLYTSITGEIGNYDDCADIENSKFYEKLKNKTVKQNNETTKADTRTCTCEYHAIETANLKKEISRLKDENARLLSKSDDMNQTINELKYEVVFQKQNVSLLRYLRTNERAISVYRRSEIAQIDEDIDDPPPENNSRYISFVYFNSEK